MMLDDITREAGAHKKRKRVGRGESSGKGKTSGRGHKGCLSRAGGGPRPLHEGGQMPIFRRLPKRGFSNFDFANRFEIVNVSRLESRFADGATVDLAALQKARLVSRNAERVKILGDGELTKKLTVEAHRFSEGARAAIQKAGGVVQELGVPDVAAKARAKRNTKRKQAGPQSAGKGAAGPAAETPAKPAPEGPGETAPEGEPNE